MGDEFRRQHIIFDFIADFVCIDKKLIVEVDGGYHSEGEQQIEDSIRTAQLNNLGFRVIRFSNEEVLYEVERVLREKRTALRQ